MSVSVSFKRQCVCLIIYIHVRSQQRQIHHHNQQRQYRQQHKRKIAKSLRSRKSITFSHDRSPPIENVTFVPESNSKCIQDVNLRTDIEQSLLLIEYHFICLLLYYSRTISPFQEIYKK